MKCPTSSDNTSALTRLKVPPSVSALSSSDGFQETLAADASWCYWSPVLFPDQWKKCFLLETDHQLIIKCTIRPKIKAKSVQSISLQCVHWLFALLSLIVLMCPNTISIGVNAIHLSFKVKASVQSLHSFSCHCDMTSQLVTSSITGSFWGEGQKGRVRGVCVCVRVCVFVCAWPQWGPYDSGIERGETSKKEA